MKRFFFLMPVIILSLFSCKKDTPELVSSSLDGTWRMILVKDNTSNNITTKPASLYGDVIITFVSNSVSKGVFNGNTPTNDLGPDVYSLGSGNTIFIPSLNMTKVAETSWGFQFVANIRDAQQYKLAAGDLLNIITSSKTLTFQKL